MPAYLNLDGDSGVINYEYGDDWIEIEFEKGTNRFYTYNYASAGRDHIERMKILADSGDGLNAYVKKHVAKHYAAKR